jgi:hypothetical protein
MTHDPNAPNHPVPPPHIKRELYALGDAPSILQKLLHEPLRSAMSRAADAGIPPATAVSGTLLDEVGPHIDSPRYKRFIGAAVSWILKLDDFEIVGQPTPVKGDRLFKSATRFVRRPPAVAVVGANTDRLDILRRIVSVLEDDELQMLADLAQGELRRVEVHTA